jgi:signal transduction histidine kinase
VSGEAGDSVSDMVSNTEEIKVLLVEDDEDDYVLTRRLLTEVYGERLRIEWADGYEAALEAMARGGHDVCLLDYRLGAGDGLALLRQANARSYPAPIIFMTGQGDREVDMEAMRAGAADYLVKGQVDAGMLERAIRYAVQQKRSEAERLELIREQAARKEAEESNRLKDEFLATVSHELRTPLNAMLGWLHLLRERRLTPEQEERALETVERSARAQHKLIEDLLDLSRVITGKLRLEVREVALAPVVEAAVESARPAAEARGVALLLDLEPQVGRVLGDPDRLQQVVWNLVSNAVKFTPAGGRVAVTLKREGPHASVTVSDTGEGVAPEFLPHVFEPSCATSSNCTAGGCAPRAPGRARARPSPCGCRSPRFKVRGQRGWVRSREFKTPNPCHRGPNSRACACSSWMTSPTRSTSPAPSSRRRARR